MSGLIRYTPNGGRSPWRTLFSGVVENLNKVVILGVTHDEVGFGAGGSNAGNQAIVVGDNGRVLYTNDAGNTWEKLERVTPEHLVAVQFNAFLLTVPSNARHLSKQSMFDLLSEIILLC